MGFKRKPISIFDLVGLDGGMAGPMTGERLLNKIGHFGPPPSRELSKAQINKIKSDFKKRGYSGSRAKKEALKVARLSKSYMDKKYFPGEKDIYKNFDFDGDGVRNDIDCYPFDSDKQRLLPRGQSYASYRASNIARGATYGSGGGGGSSAPQPAPLPAGVKKITNSITGQTRYTSTSGQAFSTPEAASAASQQIANPTAFNPNLSSYYTPAAKSAREDVNKLNPNFKQTYAVYNPATQTVFTTTTKPDWKGVPYAYLTEATPEQIAKAYAAGKSTGIKEIATTGTVDTGYEYYETEPVYGTYLDEAEYLTKREELIGKVYGDIFGQEQSLINKRLERLQNKNLKKAKWKGALMGGPTLQRQKKSKAEIIQKREIEGANTRIENLRQALYGEAAAIAPNKAIVASANKEMDLLKKNATKYGITTPSQTRVRMGTKKVTSKNYLF